MPSIKRDIKDWKSGVTIICKRCGSVQLVKQNSLCDTWNLCSDCAREDIEAGRLKPPSYFVEKRV